MQHALIAACAEDIVFWINGFCWTYDPRVRPSVIPFVLYPFQERFIRDELVDAIERQHDLCIVKSRDMGASWLDVLGFMWLWRFDREMYSYLWVSRNEDYVDDTTNPKSLFWKADFTLENCPQWMFRRSDWKRTSMKLVWHPTGSTIDGESTTGDVGRGDRRRAALLDEFAAFEAKDGFRALTSLQHTTNCRIANSTPQGIGNAFAEFAHKAEIRRTDLGWELHPLKNANLWRRSDGKWWNDWRQGEEDRATSPQECAQELDRDFLGSGFQFYDTRELDQYAQTYVQHPHYVGHLEVGENARPVGFEEQPHGQLRLWMPLVDGGWPRTGAFGIGCDIGAGTGATASVASVVDLETGEKVAEYATVHRRPEEFASDVVALCRWFRAETGSPATLVWEAPGPGRQFGDRVVELGFRNIWMKRDDRSIVRRPTDIPGWWPTKDERRAIHGRMRQMMRDGRFVNRSAESLREFRQIIYRPDGWIVNATAQNPRDPSGANENHADRPTADCLAAMLVGNLAPDLVPDDSDSPIPVGSLAWRREEAEKARLATIAKETEW